MALSFRYRRVARRLATTALQVSLVVAAAQIGMAKPATAETLARQLSFKIWPGKGDLGTHAGTQYGEWGGYKVGCEPGSGKVLLKDYTPAPGNGRQHARKAGEAPTGERKRYCWIVSYPAAKKAALEVKERRPEPKAAPCKPCRLNGG